MGRNPDISHSKPTELRFSAHFQGIWLGVARGTPRFAPTARVPITGRAWRGTYHVLPASDLWRCLDEELGVWAGRIHGSEICCNPHVSMLSGACTSLCSGAGWCWWLSAPTEAGVGAIWLLRGAPYLPKVGLLAAVSSQSHSYVLS